MTWVAKARRDRPNQNNYASYSMGGLFAERERERESHPTGFFYIKKKEKEGKAKRFLFFSYAGGKVGQFVLYSAE